MPLRFRRLSRLWLCTSVALLVAARVQAQTTNALPTLSPAARVTPSLLNPGFLWRIFANSSETTDSIQRAEDALAGKLVNRNGNPLPNLADPLAIGPATASGVPTIPNNSPLSYTIPSVINVSRNSGDSEGNFAGDSSMPGVPATDGSTDGLSIEVTTFLELPEGVITMGINSDDGFKTFGGIPNDAIQWLVLGSFDGGRGAVDTLFTFKVTQAGVYPFRTIYEQGRRDASLEWFTVNTNGTKVLINDVAHGGIKAYSAITTGTYPYPYVASIKPAFGLRQWNQPESEIELVIVDGSTVPFNENQFRLNFPFPTTTTKTREGNKVTIRTKPLQFLVPMDQFTNSFNFSSADGFARSDSWASRNLKNLILPSPSVTEDFDAYTEGGQPTGWTASNFTAPCLFHTSINNDESSTYENWVVISTNTIARIDGADTLSVNPREFLNGAPLTIEQLRSGKVLYAESDGRCEGTQRGLVLANHGGVHGQTQFITSKAFNLSAITNVVLSFGAGYKQNEDSFGGVEYSVDSGTTWLPVVYYLDESRILLKTDGTVDGVATFNAIQDDTSLWVVSGAVKGERFGDALAATIDDSIGSYIAPRRNDDGSEGKRIEAFRLPSASRKSDVRLRFSATGTDSWYFFVDNIAFYDIPAINPKTTPLSEFKATNAGTNIVLNWKGGAGNFVVQYKESLSGTWSDVSTTTNRTLSVQGTTPASFFRLLDKDAIQ